MENSKMTKKYDDVLEKHNIISRKALDLILDYEMKQTASSELVEEMYDLWKEDGKVREFYFENNQNFKGLRPYDLCIEGNEEKVRNLLGKIKHGISP